MGRLQAAWEAIKPAVPWGLMQAGLGLITEPLMTASLVYRMTGGERFFQTEEQKQAALLQIGVGAGLGGLGTYLGYGPPKWAPTDATSPFAIQTLYFQAATMGSLMLENLAAPWMQKNQPETWKVFQEFRKPQMEQVQQIFTGLTYLSAQTYVQPVIAETQASLLDLLGFGGAAKAIRQQAERTRQQYWEGKTPSMLSRITDEQLLEA